MDVRTDGKPAF